MKYEEHRTECDVQDKYSIKIIYNTLGLLGFFRSSLTFFNSLVIFFLVSAYEMFYGKKNKTMKTHPGVCQNIYLDFS